jgi:hypothetical protein
VPERFGAHDGPKYAPHSAWLSSPGAEDDAFRATASEGDTRWRTIHGRLDDDGDLIDRLLRMSKAYDR